MKKKILIAIFQLLLISSATQTWSKEVGNQLAEPFKDSVVQITTTFSNGEKIIGFGFLVGEQNDKLLIATARHIVDPSSSKIKTQEIGVRFYKHQGKNYQASLLICYQVDMDLALLETYRPTKNYSWKCVYDPSAQKGDQIWFIGREKDWYVPSDQESGSIIKTTRNEHTIKIDSIEPGCSGAPIFNNYGIVGMIIEDQVEDQAYKADALNISTIKDFMESYNYKFRCNTSFRSSYHDIFVDHQKGLMWAIHDNGYDIDWQNAMRYCKNLKLGPFNDWRMPTLHELDYIRKTETIEISGRDLWASKDPINRSKPACFDFQYGDHHWDVSPKITNNYRVLPVRNIR